MGNFKGTTKYYRLLPIRDIPGFLVVTERSTTMCSVRHTVLGEFLSFFGFSHKDTQRGLWPQPKKLASFRKNIYRDGGFSQFIVLPFFPKNQSIFSNKSGTRYPGEDSFLPVEGGTGGKEKKVPGKKIKK